MASVTEITPNIYRISTYIPDANLQFNQFLVDDDEPLLFHTGLLSLFPDVIEAVSTVIDPVTLRWITFSHYEADECAALNNWLEIAPSAQAACSNVGKIVSVDDVAVRPARGLTHNEVINTGTMRFRFLQTPHVPHAWDAGLLFEEKAKVLLCSDILHQSGDVEAIADGDVIMERSRNVLTRYQHTPLANYLPYTPYTGKVFEEIASLNPAVCSTMHGSTFIGDGGAIIREFGELVRSIYASPDIQPRQVPQL